MAMVLGLPLLFTLGCGGGEDSATPSQDATSGDDGAADAQPDTSTSDSMSDEGADAEAPVACDWRSEDEGLVGGTVEEVIFDQRASKTVYASSGRLLAVSRDSGASWTALATAPSRVRRLTFPASPANTMFAASGDGVLRSLDGGTTWETYALAGTDIWTVQAHPTDALKLFAAAPGLGILASTNAGKSWAPTLGVPSGDATSIVINGKTPNVLITGMVLLNDSGGLSANGTILRSTNGGATWARIFEGTSVFEVAGCAANPDTLYAATRSGLLRSTDAGVNWAPRAHAGRIVTSVRVTGSDCETVYANIYSSGLVRSTDAGASWSTPLVAGLKLQANMPNVNRVAVDPGDATRIVGATHGGLYVSTNAGSAWTLAPAFKNVAVRALVAVGDTTYLSSFGSGLWSRTGGSTAWTRVESFPGDWLFGTYAAKDVVVAAGYLSDVYRSADGAKTFSSVLTSTNMFGLAASGTRLLGATQTHGILRSDDNGVTWTPSNGGLTAWPTPVGTFIDIRHLVTDPTDPNRVVAGSGGRGLFRSVDGGGNWTALGGVFADDEIGCLLIAAGELWSCGHRAGVHRSKDFGTTWESTGAGLPGTRVDAMVTDGAGGLWAVCEGEVFQRTESKWTSFAPESCRPTGAGALTVVGSGASRRLLMVSSRGLVSHSIP